MYEQMSRATTKFARKKEERTKRNASTIRAMSVPSLIELPRLPRLATSGHIQYRLSHFILE
jgi:hypothetical protein